MPVLRLSSLLMMRDAALAGAGAATLPKLLVADDVATGLERTIRSHRDRETAA